MMLRLICSLVIALASTIVVAREVNYDESKVGEYVLESPLEFANGTKVASAADWSRRRNEIVDIFAREMYGRIPPAPAIVVSELVEEGSTLAGLAIRRQYRMWFNQEKSGPYLDWLVVIPNFIHTLAPKIADGRVVCENEEKCPVVIMLNYGGNHTILTDKQVVVPENIWLRPSDEHIGCKPSLTERGLSRDTDFRAPVPIETIIARGYALITACYGQVSPDAESSVTNLPPGFAYSRGVFELWPKRDERESDNITALGAWAWALSRGLDLAYTISEIDAKKVVATGFSRLAKTALLASSRDERFTVCVANQTGGGGATLAKRNFGENISTEMDMFPHWYCKAYGKYVDNEQALAFDQHLLLASIAPRSLMVQGFNAGWFDPHGEFLACKAASSAWEFLGKKGLSSDLEPVDYSLSAAKGDIAYVRRGGEHGISGSDWHWMLDFADRALGRVQQ